MTTPPRLFISYCWSTPDHQQWVLKLATELVDNGVDVTLDKWGLREGHDSIKFMETMVTDKSVKKVLLICDQAYAQKADLRSGGVGTETQIITPEIYAQQEQDKFVAVIVERDEHGQPYLPTYYKGRIFIDFSRPGHYVENFEQLLRWVFDKPVHTRPEIGPPPSFATDPDTSDLGTSASARRAMEAFRAGRSNARGSFDEYLSVFAKNLERFRLPKHPVDDRSYEDVVKSIEGSIRPLDEFVWVGVTLIQYADPMEYAPRIIQFFEALIPYLSRPASVTSYMPTDFDNFKFIIHELYLYTLATLIRLDRLDAASFLISRMYYAPGDSRKMVDYTIFCSDVDSLKIRTQVLGSRRLSLRADILLERADIVAMPFQCLMQADLVCFLRSLVTDTRSWRPETLVYSSRQYGQFEIFARSRSREYLKRVLSLLGVSDLAQLEASLDNAQQILSTLGSDFSYPNLSTLISVEHLGTHE